MQIPPDWYVQIVAGSIYLASIYLLSCREDRKAVMQPMKEYVFATVPLLVILSYLIGITTDTLIVKIIRPIIVDSGIMPSTGMISLQGQEIIGRYVDYDQVKGYENICTSMYFLRSLFFSSAWLGLALGISSLIEMFKSIRITKIYFMFTKKVRTILIILFIIAVPSCVVILGSLSALILTAILILSIFCLILLFRSRKKVITIGVIFSKKVQIVLITLFILIAPFFIVLLNSLFSSALIMIVTIGICYVLMLFSSRRDINVHYMFGKFVQMILIAMIVGALFFQWIESRRSYMNLQRQIVESAQSKSGFPFK